MFYSFKPDSSDANPDGFGIYKSIDSGKNWFSVGRGRDVRNFIIDPVNSNIAYAATVQSILRTSDDGETWSTVGLTLPNPFINGLAIDWLNPNILFCGPARSGVWKTVDGGSHWNPRNNGLPEKCTALAIVVNYLNPDILYAITDEGGFYISYNGGDVWYALELVVKDMRINKNSFKIDPLNPEFIFVGTDGHGIFRIKNSYN